MSAKTPIVTIIGRSNAGKSSLLNAVSGKRQAIVAKEAGTTRDSVMARITTGSKTFVLVDTAGLKTAQDEFEASIQQQITEAAQSADIIWVVVDASTAITDEDRRVAKLALKSGKPVLLVANKADLKNSSLQNIQTLGIKDTFATSASQRRGIDELIRATAEVLPASPTSSSTTGAKLVIAGRPNAGKSALFNSLAKKQQVLVSDRAGTTRDAVSLSLGYKSAELQITDTAGIRRGGKVEKGVEKFSVLRALAAIEDSDVVLLVMDQAEAGTHMDQKIAGLAADSGKGLILVVSKWDLADHQIDDRREISDRLARDFVFVPWAPLVFTSARTGLNVTKLFELAVGIYTSRQTQIPTPKLNRWLRQAVEAHPPAGLRNSHPRLKYIAQERSVGEPTFKIQGSHTGSLHWSYKRYLERSFRQIWPFEGTPLRFIFSSDSSEKLK